MTIARNKGGLVPSILTPTLTENPWLQASTLIIRIVVGLLMIHNGLDKLANVQGFADNVVAFIGLPFPVFLTYCAAYVEVISSILLIFGLATRLNGIALFSTMCVAIFFHLKGDGMHIKPLETASLYALIYLFFTTNGAGRFSLDALLGSKLSTGS